MEKMTQRDYFNAIVATLNGEETNVSTEDMVTFVKGRIALLDKKSANKKPTKTQVENVALKATILEVLGDMETPVTVSEILVDPRIGQGVTSQKVSALLKQMVEVDHTVEKIVDKRKSLFSIPTVE